MGGNLTKSLELPAVAVLPVGVLLSSAMLIGITMRREKKEEGRRVKGERVLDPRRRDKISGRTNKQINK